MFHKITTQLSIQWSSRLYSRKPDRKSTVNSGVYYFLEAGSEAAFFGGRLGLDVTYYRNKNKDQILTLPIATSSGYTARVTNIGKVTNKGIELLLSTVRTKNFSWEITGTYTRKQKPCGLIAEGDQVPIGGLGAATLVARKGEDTDDFLKRFLRDSLGHVVVEHSTGYPSTDPIAKTHGTVQPDYIAAF